MTNRLKLISCNVISLNHMGISCQGEERNRLQLVPRLLPKNLDIGGRYMKNHRRDTVVIFRRYKKLPNGEVLGAHDYGHKAWRFVIKKHK